ncbi:MAG: amino acid ABC transporter substrate-binding protein [Chloroflexota bacterium]|nr:amino acid ABC transporter substrate-binding protein [Chloroflexota bacterium]MDE3192530.1 amino acid ABC transporter substrate-binding protein [Chloroflexota bacterium]
MRIRTLGAATLASLFVAAACGGTAAPSAAPSVAASAAASAAATQAAPGEIKIGAVLPLTGPFNASGKYFQQGYELATKEVNDKGGLDVGGKKYTIKLSVLDDGSNGTKSRSLVEQLVTQDKVTALLGGYDTSLVEAQQAVPDQYKIPMVEGGGAASAIFTRGNKYLFGTLATVDILGANTMDFLKYWIDQGKLPKPLTIALTWENTDHGKDYEGAVQKAAKDHPDYFKVLLDQSFELNASDFTALLTQVKAANADAFLSDAHLPDFITMHKQYLQMGLKHKFVSYGARGPDQKGREALGAGADYLVAGVWWTPAQPDKGSQDFTAKWKAAYKVTPDWFQALGYETARVLYAGITKAGALDGTKIRDALSSLTFTGSILPGGTISFDATGKPKTEYVFTQNLPGANNPVQLVWPKNVDGYKDAIMPLPSK